MADNYYSLYWANQRTSTVLARIYSDLTHPDIRDAVIYGWTHLSPEEFNVILRQTRDAHLRANPGADPDHLPPLRPSLFQIEDALVLALFYIARGGCYNVIGDHFQVDGTLVHQAIKAVSAYVRNSIPPALKTETAELLRMK